MRLFIEDCYKGVSYALDEDGYAEAEFQDVVRKRFVRGWDVLLEGYRVRLRLLYTEIALSPLLC